MVENVVFQLNFFHPDYMQIAELFKHKVICYEYDISISYNKNNFEIGTLFGELPSLSFITE